MSTSTFPYWALAPNAFTALKKFTEALESGSIDNKLQNLIYLRISQINGCAYCTQLLRHAIDRGQVQDFYSQSDMRCHEKYGSAYLFILRQSG